ncbi:hypothetical protein GCM10009093_00660 [Brevundimonas terrae]|jgi:hypothetical protein|uniref:Uncharacterized protein n=1 Tax=Brevundimonas terrae TaxID=363631 RepID=A0ABP3HS94_9CAUL|nr:hypothetical protein [Brevundimonas terrae]NIJ27847.1 hypothetical protein [Brevundimonas terrae]
MVQSWGLEAARNVLRSWARQRVDEATRKDGLAVQFDGLEAWLLAQDPHTLEEAERILSILDAFQNGRTEGLDALTRAGGEHRRDGVPESRVSHSFAPRAYGPMGGRA